MAVRRDCNRRERVSSASEFRGKNSTATAYTRPTIKRGQKTREQCEHWKSSLTTVRRRFAIDSVSDPIVVFGERLRARLLSRQSIITESQYACAHTHIRASIKLLMITNNYSDILEWRDAAGDGYGFPRRRKNLCH